MNNNNEVIDNLRHNLETGSIDINAFSEDNYIICDGDHETERKIREGNRFYMIITGNEDNWNIDGVKCTNCNIKDIFNSVTHINKGYISVVESVFKRKNLNTDQLELVNYNLWELTRVDKPKNKN